jgi:lipid-A-disaccharide synthase
MVVAYKIAPLTNFIVKRLGMLRTQTYSLPNILAGRQIVPELMQDACTPAELADALLPFLQTRTLPADLRSEFRRLHETLRADADAAAAAVAQLLSSSTNHPA